MGGPYIGGNYWGDYIGVDDGSDGRPADDYIGDTELPYNNSESMSDGDYLPLMYFNMLPEMQQVFVNSSSGNNLTVDNLFCPGDGPSGPSS